MKIQSEIGVWPQGVGFAQILPLEGSQDGLESQRRRAVGGSGARPELTPIGMAVALM